MKRIILLLAGVLFGVGVGWYFGYSRPSAEYQREMQQRYQQLRDTSHLTDAEMAQIVSKMPEYFQDMKRQDESTAVFALGAFNALEQGDTDRAKTHLLEAVGNYYREYHDRGGDRNFIAKIDEAAQKYPAVAAAISRKIE